MILRQAIVDRYFRITVFIKLFDGIMEVLGSLLLLIISPTTIHGLVALLTTHELAEDPHAFIANYIRTLDQKVTPGTEIILALFLFLHGSIKVVLAYALLTRKYHYFPAAIAFLIAFLFYEVYLVGLNHSIVLALFAALDAVIIWLTYLEYVRHRPKRLS